MAANGGLILYAPQTRPNPSFESFHSQKWNVQTRRVKKFSRKESSLARMETGNGHLKFRCMKIQWKLDGWKCQDWKIIELNDTLW